MANSICPFLQPWALCLCVRNIQENHNFFNCPLFDQTSPLWVIMVKTSWILEIKLIITFDTFV